MKTPLFLLIALSACVCLSVAVPDNGPRTIAELQAQIENALKVTHTTGAAIAIVSRDKAEWVAGLGTADVATNKPVTSKTPFLIGSISKSFAALAVLKLQEEGRLKLSDTLRQWVPEYAFDNPWEVTDPVRLVHLLEHTSGLPDLTMREFAFNNSEPITLKEALAVAPQNRYARWRPGTRQAYSNVGPALIAAVIEKVTGQRFEDYVQENLFAPLGMAGAGYFLTPEVEQNLVKSYQPDGRTPAPYQHLVYRATGTIHASAEDMANYVRFYLQRGSLDGHLILQPSSIDRMEVPGTLPAVREGVTWGYGLCLGSRFPEGYELIGHDGGISGAALATFNYNKQSGRGYAIMINSGNGGALGWITYLVFSYMKQNLPPHPAVPPTVALSPDMQKRYGGYYATISPQRDGFFSFSDQFSSVRKVTFDDKGLSLQRVLLPDRPDRWLPLSETLYRREPDPKPGLAIVRGEGGEPWIQYDYGTLAQISPTGFWLQVGGFVFSLLMMISAVLFAPVWGLRKALGRLPASYPVSLRCFPLLGALSFFGFIALYAAAGSGGYAVLGTANALTIGMMLISFGIPLGALLSGIAVWRHRNAPMNRVAYWHSVLVTLSLVFITGMSLHWGVIGLRLWA